jgi:hypothetical protein
MGIIPPARGRRKIVKSVIIGIFGIMGFALVLLIAILVVGLTGGYSNQTTPTLTPPPCVLTIVSYGMTTDAEFMDRPRCEGLARNNGSTQVHSAWIDIDYYDSNGYLVGSGGDSVSDLEPGQTWIFGHTYVFSGYEDVVSCDIEVFCCY